VAWRWIRAGQHRFSDAQGFNPMSDWRSAVDDYVDSLAERLRALRRCLHAHPEISGEEYQTTAYLAKLLAGAGLMTRVPPLRRGILVDGGGEGPCVAMRADLDALPLHDEKDVEYRSTRDGATHACGHDAHSAMLYGACLALQHCAEHLPWPLAWRGVFQPSEETTHGAEEMIGAGALEGVRAIVGLHADPAFTVGQVGVRYGHLTAACEELQVIIRGIGGHAARPHCTDDPIAIATQFVNAIYQFVPRSVDSRDPVVVSFGMIRAGTNANVIPEQVELKGTIRTMGGETAALVRERILAVAHGFSEASRARIDVHFQRGAESVFNDARVTAVCEVAARDVVGDEMIQTIALPSMGSEDFSAYLAHVPGSLLRLGVAGGPSSSHALHTPRFDLDERALTIGAKVLAHSAVHLAGPHQD
jgi:amidohydrolase